MDLKPYPRATSRTSYLPLDIQPDKLHTKIMDLLRHMAATLDNAHGPTSPVFHFITKSSNLLAHIVFFYPLFFCLEITINLFALFLPHTLQCKKRPFHYYTQLASAFHHSPYLVYSLLIRDARPTHIQ